ncbi:hypothetical protein [Laspinema olomoucense]|uniref:hypothetical protein n=1 Tax=Laspinema olomoucense TaxID=3231600 RepID=UPI0021BB0B03|nr:MULTISPECIES: hypothetical protein [unclassified Laspinema]MCT7991967.1 hypothetical protein [Laspinema sp. D3a]MCT7994100.1 hypothetical protein [Laspinema sp. D3c]
MTPTLAGGTWTIRVDAVEESWLHKFFKITPKGDRATKGIMIKGSQGQGCDRIVERSSPLYPGQEAEPIAFLTAINCIVPAAPHTEILPVLAKLSVLLYQKVTVLYYNKKLIFITKNKEILSRNKRTMMFNLLFS